MLVTIHVRTTVDYFYTAARIIISSNPFMAITGAKYMPVLLPIITTASLLDLQHHYDIGSLMIASPPQRPVG